MPTPSRVKSTAIAWFLGSLTLLSSPSVAAESNVAASLLSEAASVTPGVPFHAGIRMRMRPGWHVYWKNPGDSGLPPKITWSLPGGFSAGPIEWPVPERFQDEMLMSYGYAGEVILPVEMIPPATIDADSVTISGALQWLECQDVCLPGAATVRFSLPVSTQKTAPGPDAAALAAARSKVPGPPSGWSLSAEAGPRTIALAFDPPSGLTPRSAYLFVDQPLVTEHAAPQGFGRSRDGYRLTLQPAANASGNPARLSGVLWVEGRGSKSAAIRVDVPVAGGDPDPASAPPNPRKWPLAATVGVVAIAGLGLLLLKRRARPTSTRT